MVLDLALHPHGDRRCVAPVARGRAEVPDRRELRLGDPPLRERVRLRRNRLDRLQRHRRGSGQRRPPLLRHGPRAHPRRPRLQDVGGAVPHVDAGRLPGSADSGDGVHVRGDEGGGARRHYAAARDGLPRRRAALDGGARRHRVRLTRLGQSRRARPDGHQAPARILKHLARGVHAHPRRRGDKPRWARTPLLPHLVCGDEPRLVRDRRRARTRACPAGDLRRARRPRVGAPPPRRRDEPLHVRVHRPAARRPLPGQVLRVLGGRRTWVDLARDRRSRRHGRLDLLLRRRDRRDVLPPAGRSPPRPRGGPPAARPRPGDDGGRRGRRHRRELHRRGPAAHHRPRLRFLPGIPALMARHVVVLGGGVSGEAFMAALRRRDKDIRMTLVEHELVGGECSYWACIPSKTLLRPLELAFRSRYAPGTTATVDPVQVFKWRDEVAGKDDTSQVEWVRGLDAGAVGCELAQFYARIGSKVTLVQSGDYVLPRIDRDAGDLLAEFLREEGIDIHLNARATRVERTNGSIRLELEGEAPIEAAHILVATGRKPHVDGLGLENLGVRVGRQGIEVDDRLSAADHGWAAGDVTGVALFTHLGKYQGRIAAANVAGADLRADYRAIPAAIFTDPQVASVGDTSGDSAVVAKWDVTKVSRAATFQRPKRPGFVKVFADPERHVLVGAVVVGPEAGEWLGQLTLAIRAEVPIRILLDTIQPFPTFSEAIFFAARELDL